jgi:uncharacterized protein (DUF2336 family)
MPNAQPLVAELHEALDRTPSAKYPNILARLTDLFVDKAASYSGDHVEIFDDIMGRLIEKIEKLDHSALIDVSAKLAPIGNAPAGVVGRLSQDNDLAVAGPVLEKSCAITDAALVEVATTKGPRHLAAIASRPQIGEPIVDALVERGIPDLTLKLVRNENARLSEMAFVKLVNRAKGDKTLAAGLATRKDLPAELQPFLDLALA